jgi:hypothetical protein
VPGAAGPSLDRVFPAAGRRVLAMHPGDEEGRMLRSPGLTTAGKSYAFATAADLVVKLLSSRADELGDSGRGLPRSPRARRPMKEWVRVPAPDEEFCPAYPLEARSFVSAGAAADGNRPPAPAGAPAAASTRRNSANTAGSCSSGCDATRTRRPIQRCAGATARIKG